ncbi:hypothetical protein K9M47_04035 [Candidatus Gracilibacteria bacterium]|nr:hypothetical protein [Candidatus Gracilibacteria bacterium]
MKKKEIKITYVYDKNISEEDQRMVNKAFDVLFNVVYEKYWKKGYKTEKKK